MAATQKARLKSTRRAGVAEPYRTAALLEPGPARRHVAAAVLTVLEGARLLETFIPGSTPEAVALLSSGLVAKRAR